MTFIKKISLFVLLLWVFVSCREKQAETAASILKKTGKLIKITQIDNIQFAWELMSLKKYHEMLVAMNIPLNIKKPTLNKQQYALLVTLIDLQTGEIISNAEITVHYIQKKSTIKPSPPALKKLSGAGMHHYGAIIPVLVKVNHLKIGAKIFLDGMDYASEISF